MGGVASIAAGMMLLGAACTSGDTAGGPNSSDNGVIGSTSSESQTTETVELLPYDEQITVPEGPDADDDAVDDSVAIGDDNPDTTSATTTQNGSNPSLGSIVPPDEDPADPDTTTTTAPAATNSTNPPLNSEEEQPLQEQDTALVCATVELGYLQQLGGNDGSERLRDGATMAIATGVREYVEAGEGLVEALDAASGIDGAADVLLSQCETDGFERLA